MKWKFFVCCQKWPWWQCVCLCRTHTVFHISLISHTINSHVLPSSRVAAMAKMFNYGIPNVWKTIRQSDVTLKLVKKKIREINMTRWWKYFLTWRKWIYWLDKLSRFHRALLQFFSLIFCRPLSARFYKIILPLIIYVFIYKLHAKSFMNEEINVI